MSNKNKFGLSRDIPDPIQRIVRQRSGFGCVICGCAIYTYEHIDPTFEEATEHNPDNMTLLCGTCHSYVTKGIWSKDKVKLHAKNPVCLQKGFSWGAFDIGSLHPEVILGSSRWIDTPIVVRAMNETILKIEPSDFECGPYKLSGIFCNKDETEIFRIIENQWKGLIENWDIEIVGQTITVRRGKGDIALKLRTKPPSKIIVEQINMIYKGASIIGKYGSIICVKSPDGSTIAVSPITGDSCHCGIEVGETSVSFGIRCKSVGLI
jgi:hypothetical protein